jgi:hypothetical protein
MPTIVSSMEAGSSSASIPVPGRKSKLALDRCVAVRGCRLQGHMYLHNQLGSSEGQHKENMSFTALSAQLMVVILICSVQDYYYYSN